jgi:hypothetical protein
MDRGALFCSCGECDMDQLGSVSFCSPCLNQFWSAASFVGSFWEAWLVQQYHGQGLLWFIGPQCTAGIISALWHCLGAHPHSSVSQFQHSHQESAVVHRPAVHSRYTLWHCLGTHSHSSEYSVSTFTRRVCFANRIVSHGNNSERERETVLTYTVV